MLNIMHYALCIIHYSFFFLPPSLPLGEVRRGLLRQPHLLCLLHQQFHERLTLVLHYIVEHSLL